MTARGPWGDGIAHLQHREIRFRERLDAVADGLKVVDEPDLGQAELARKRGGADFPREVGDLDRLAR